MGYIDIAIPLIAGLILIAIPDKLIPTKDATFEKKKSLLTKSGFLLIMVAVLFFVIKILEQ
ncbi:MAG: hypothetical protein ABI729_06400 [Chitinophagales bacterium]